MFFYPDSAPSTVSPDASTSVGDLHPGRVAAVVIGVILILIFVLIAIVITVFIWRRVRLNDTTGVFFLLSFRVDPDLSVIFLSNRQNLEGKKFFAFAVIIFAN